MHGDIVERFFQEQFNQRVAQSIAGASHALILLFLPIIQVSGHGTPLCSISTRAHAGQLTNRSLKLKA